MRTTRLCSTLCVLGLALAVLGQFLRVFPSFGLGSVDRHAEFGPPQVILDDSEHGAGLRPYYADFDGDGKVDQLIGAWDRLLVYRNHGTNAEPKYAKPIWFDEAEPSGRIPAG